MTRAAGRAPSGSDGPLIRPAYRPDVDGLRAVAVIAVISFHATVPGFDGGFVGVDVFFVVSGYLITLLLLGGDEGAPGARLSAFYLRRARRILPALITVLLASSVAAAAILLPDDLASFGRYLAATPVFLANVAAWSQVGYFDAAWPVPPLLHLWSIGVEEQFYLAYPVVLLLVSRRGPRFRLAALALAAAASLALCVWGVVHHPVANFYLPASRAWELLLGALVAVAPPRAPRSVWFEEARSATALAVIVVAACTYEASMPYPSLLTLAPCLATAALLAHCPDRATRLERLLAHRALVWIGLMSYSLYLWHLPVIAFARYYLVEPSGLAVLWMLGLTALLAVLSWRWVEQPVRTRAVLRSNRAFAWTAGTASVAVACLGVGAWAAHGLPGRVEPGVLAYATGADSVHRDALRCMTLNVQDIDGDRLCHYGPASGEAIRALVWGDSHAMALLPAFEGLAETHHASLYFAARSSCQPTFDVGRAGEAGAGRRCQEFNLAMARAVQRLRPGVIVLSAYWSHPAGSPRGPGWRTPPAPPLASGLQRTLDAISDQRRLVCVVLDPPTLAYSAPYALAMARRRDIDPGFLNVPRRDALGQYRAAEQQIRALEASGRVRTVDLKEALCPATECEVQRDGRSLYMDKDHLSVEGARAVTGVLERCFDDPRLASHHDHQEVVAESAQHRPAGDASVEPP